jgi:SAM-dependent methyltransferase
MPYQDTYVPLLHLVVAVTTSFGHVSAAQAYHTVTGVIYALGPLTLYLLAVRLGAHRGAAFLAALFYSLFSPSALLMPEVARDIGGLWFARRLQVLTVYGEGPHISAMSMLPIAILALQIALTKRSGRTLVLAAVSIAIVFLTNVPGTMALGLTVFCWLCAQPAEQRRPAWATAVFASVFAYCLACYGLPPSSLRTVFGNAGAMHPGFSNSLHYGPVWLMLVFACVVGAGHILTRTRATLVVRFAILYFGLIAALATRARFQTFELLPQVGRLHLEMEMGASLLLGCGGWALYVLIPRWIRPVVLALLLAPIGIQFDHYRSRAQMDINYVDLEKRSEYTTARWLDSHLNGQRVYVSGSTSFWLNAFTDVPQMAGCCDQGQSMPVLNDVPGFINAAVSLQNTALAKIWLEALGVQALVVNGEGSTDEYKDFREPQRFERFFTPLHRENGDTIYAVLPEGSSLAHVLRPGETVGRRPSNPADAGEVARYVEAIGNSTRPRATFEWLHGGAARIRASLHRDDLVSVQVAWFPGWKALVHGERRPVGPDGLGFMVIRPKCEGNCEIALLWTGRPDLPYAAVVSVAALGLAAMLFYRRKPFAGRGMGHAIMERMTVAQAEVTPRYQFKAGPYSSHSLLLAQFPERGEGRRVLDIGCAAGYLSEILVERGYSVACVDWPGTPHPATVEFSGGDLDDGLGPVDGKFEYIICADVIEHLRDPLRLLKECRERLAQGGTLMASLPNSAHWYFRWNVLMGRFPQHERGLFDSTHLHFYAWSGWVNLLDRAGFAVETVGSSAVPVGLALPAWDGSLLVRSMEWMSVACARVWRTLFAYQFIVRARAK